jgi:hypothetical protein
VLNLQPKEMADACRILLPWLLRTGYQSSPRKKAVELLPQSSVPSSCASSTSSSMYTSRHSLLQNAFSPLHHKKRNLQLSQQCDLFCKCQPKVQKDECFSYSLIDEDVPVLRQPPRAAAAPAGRDSIRRRRGPLGEGLDGEHHLPAPA